MRISKFGLLLIIIGIFLLLSTYSMFNFDFSRDWPWILVIIGLFILIKNDRHGCSFINVNSSKNKKSRENRKEILEKLQKNEINLDEAMKKMKEEE